jgi:hypothetical protein
LANSPTALNDAVLIPVITVAETDHQSTALTMNSVIPSSKHPQHRRIDQRGVSAAVSIDCRAAANSAWSLESTK